MLTGKNKKLAKEFLISLEKDIMSSNSFSFSQVSGVDKFLNKEHIIKQQPNGTHQFIIEVNGGAKSKCVLIDK